MYRGYLAVRTSMRHLFSWITTLPCKTYLYPKYVLLKAPSESQHLTLDKWENFYFDQLEHDFLQPSSSWDASSNSVRNKYAPICAARNFLRNKPPPAKELTTMVTTKVPPDTLLDTILAKTKAIRSGVALDTITATGPLVHILSSDIYPAQCVTAGTPPHRTHFDSTKGTRDQDF